MKGLFLSFEGSDASGKSTQIGLLREWLEAQGIHPLVTREPGGTAIGERIRDILLDPGSSEMLPVTEALLYAASRAQHVGQVIRPALEEGRVVITDRFVDSSIAYQGYGRKLGSVAEEINAPAVDGVMPDLTILLVVDPEDMRRRRSTGEEDRIEAEGLAFQSAVREGFLQIAEREKERFLVIDGRQPVDVIAGEIRRAVAALAGLDYEQ